MPKTVLVVDDRQHATILAALRGWQRAKQIEFMPEYDIATSAGTVEPLTPDEIDDLCETINVVGSPVLIDIHIEDRRVSMVSCDDAALIPVMQVRTFDYDTEDEHGCQKEDKPDVKVAFEKDLGQPTIPFHLAYFKRLTVTRSPVLIHPNNV